MNDEPSGSRSSPLLRGLALGTQIGLSLAVPLLAFSLLGRWIDRQAGTFPLFFLSGFVLALIVGLVLVRRAVKSVAGPW